MSSLGQRPRECEQHRWASAESAIHSGIGESVVEARFQRLSKFPGSWGDAPGSDEIAPMALDRSQPLTFLLQSLNGALTQRFAIRV
jgi:hypothetical protein